MSQHCSEPEANEIATLIGPLWSETKVCDALRVTADALAERRINGTVLAVTTTDGDRFYPVDQFVRHDGVAEMRDALLPLLQALRGFDPWSVAVLLQTPAPELDDRTPLDWLRRGGQSQALADLGRTVAREWNAGGPG